MKTFDYMLCYSKIDSFPETIINDIINKINFSYGDGCSLKLLIFQIEVNSELGLRLVQEMNLCSNLSF